MLTEYYNNTVAYLTDTLGANFILFIILITTTASIGYFIVLSYIITQMDTRYFVRKNIADKSNTVIDLSDKPYLQPISQGLMLIAGMIKMIVGVFLLLCGIAMLALPGQGIITILIGLSLIPFPGKHKLEQSLLSRQTVRSSLNWIRSKAKKPPFIFD